MKTSRKYRDMRFCCINKESFEIIDIFAKRLEKLSTCSTFETSETCDLDVVSLLPKLKRLCLVNLPYKVEEWIISCVKASNIQLDEFSIDNFDCSCLNRLTTFQTFEFIMQQNNLKTLAIERYKFDSLSSTDIASLMNYHHKAQFNQMKKFSMTTTSDVESTFFKTRMPKLHECIIFEKFVNFNHEIMTRIKLHSVGSDDFLFLYHFSDVVQCCRMSRIKN
jgi:hypothetical protein